MTDKLKMKKVYKCSVKNCCNLVVLPGCFCKRCIDTMTDENYNVYYCHLCNKVTFIYHKEDFIEELRESDNKYDSRIRLECCEKCFKDLFDDLGRELFD